jgi:hypothetical protein
MGREVRRVPKDWQHPKKRHFNYLKSCYEEVYQPMFDRPFAPEMREWIAKWEAWERGERPDYCSDESKNLPFLEWDSPPPDPAYYRPDWPEETRTHLMMYEDTSEGTPISPAFETPEELARWLADNKASAFGSETATYEDWLHVCRGGYAPSMVRTMHTDGTKTMQSGVSALSEDGGRG